MYCRDLTNYLQCKIQWRWILLLMDYEKLTYYLRSLNIRIGRTLRTTNFDRTIIYTFGFHLQRSRCRPNRLAKLLVPYNVTHCFFSVFCWHSNSSFQHQKRNNISNLQRRFVTLFTFALSANLSWLLFNRPADFYLSTADLSAPRLVLRHTKDLLPILQLICCITYCRPNYRLNWEEKINWR